ncbi:MAG: ABC transporter permease [bacterium]
MTGYILRRVLYIIPLVIIISIISFVIIQAPPGDFLSSQVESLKQQYGSDADMMIEAMRERYGLGEPLYKQYFNWMWGIVTRGDFGYSFEEKRPVTDIIKARIPITVGITLLTLSFTWIIGIPIGIYSAVKQHSIFDYIFTFLAFIGAATPNFLLALVLMFLTYNYLGWDVGGLMSLEFQGASFSLAKLINILQHLILPVIVIGTAGTAGIVRTLRSMVLDELGKQYVQTARSKGITEKKVIWKHVFRVAILPIVSTIGWVLPTLISGEVITSIVLNLPTTGESMFRALENQDMYVAGSFVLLLSTLTIIGTLISDILLAMIDPRIKYT